MEKQNKSILDGIAVDDSAYKPYKLANQGVVGCCPVCGSPIYGPKYVPEGTTPVVTRSCTCNSVVGKTGTK